MAYTPDIPASGWERWTETDCSLGALTIVAPRRQQTYGRSQPTKKIYYIKPGGNDSLNGESLANAWADILKARDTMQPGDELRIAPGTYEWAAGPVFSPDPARPWRDGQLRQCIYWTQSGTASDPIVIRNIPGEDPPLIRCPANRPVGIGLPLEGQPYDRKTAPTIFRLASVHDVILYNLRIQGNRYRMTIDGYTADQMQIGVELGNVCYNITIENCWIYACLHCGFKDSQAIAHDYLVRGNWFWDHGVNNTTDHSTYHPSKYARFIGNVSWDSWGWHFHGYSGNPLENPQYCVVANNIMFARGSPRRGQDGILQSGDDSVFYHNLVFQSGRRGIRLYGGANRNIVKNNVFLVCDDGLVDSTNLPASPSDYNVISYNVLYPQESPHWAWTDATVLPQASNNTFQDIRTHYQNIATYDFRLLAGQGISVPHVTIPGILNQPDLAGPFSADYYIPTQTGTQSKTCSITGTGSQQSVKQPRKKLFPVGVNLVSSQRVANKRSARTGQGTVSAPKFAAKQIETAGAGSASMTKFTLKLIAALITGVGSLVSSRSVNKRARPIGTGVILRSKTVDRQVETVGTGSVSARKRLGRIVVAVGTGVVSTLTVFLELGATVLNITGVIGRGVRSRNRND